MCVALVCECVFSMIVFHINCRLAVLHMFSCICMPMFARIVLERRIASELYSNDVFVLEHPHTLVTRALTLLLRSIEVRLHAESKQTRHACARTVAH
jgi:hypothetical protein